MKRRWFITGLALSGIAAGCQQASGGSTTGGRTTEEPNEATDSSTVTVVRNSNTLVMATTANYPPYQQRVERGPQSDSSQETEIVGFDIDLARLVAQRMERELAVVDLDFGALIPAVMNDEVDMAMAALEPSRSRKQKVDFSHIYYRARHALVSLDGYLSANDLTFQTIGVLSNSVQARFAETLVERESIDVVPYRTLDEIFEALDIGAITGALMEATIASNYLPRYPDFEAQLMPSDKPTGSAIAIAKNSPLRREINAAITDIKASGEMDELITQWFG